MSGLADATHSFAELSSDLQEIWADCERAIVCWIDRPQFRPLAGASIRANILCEVLKSYAEPLEGEVYRMSTFDIIAAFPLANDESDAEVIGRLDRLLRRPESAAVSDLAEFYELPRDLDILIARAEASEPVDDSVSFGEEGPRPNRNKQARPLTFDMLGRLENGLRGAEMISFLRKQTALSFQGNKSTKLLLQEYYVSFDLLSAAIVPEYNVRSKHSFFQFLTSLIDASVIRALPDVIGKPTKAPISINMSLERICEHGSMVDQLDRIRALTPKLYIEFAANEVFSYQDEYLIVRDYLRDQGIGIVIDRIKPSQIRMIDPIFLDANFYKVLWTEAIRTEGSGNVAFQSFYMMAEPHRIILSHCDSVKALQFGLRHHITNFQGYFIDRYVMQKDSQQKDGGKKEAAGSSS